MSLSSSYPDPAIFAKSAINWPHGSGSVTPPPRKKNKKVYLIVNAVDGACDFFGRTAEVAVGLELHVTLVARLVIHHLHLAAIV